MVAGGMLAALLAAAPDAMRAFPDEPSIGQLHGGEQVLVDDGTCPAGQIKLVTGGSNRSYENGSPRPGTPRTVRCVARRP